MRQTCVILERIHAYKDIPKQQLPFTECLNDTVPRFLRCWFSLFQTLSPWRSRTILCISILTLLGGLRQRAARKLSRSSLGMTHFNVGAIGRRSWAGAIHECLFYDATAHRLLL